MAKRKFLRLPLYLQILLGMIAGIGIGLLHYLLTVSLSYETG